MAVPACPDCIGARRMEQRLLRFECYPSLSLNSPNFGIG